MKAVEYGGLRFSRIASLIVIALCTLFSDQTSAESETSKRYVTSYGFGPDKWATIWLIERHGGIVNVYGNEKLIPTGNNIFAFDVTTSNFKRTGSNTSYSTLYKKFGRIDVVTSKMGHYIFDIEIGALNGQVSQDSRIVEHGFRGMQLRYGREQVTKACYLHFFNNVAAAIETDELTALSSKDFIPEESCMDNKSGMPKEALISVQVPTLDLQAAFESYVREDKIIFVDTRETWEFEEGRIPGAINIKLREVENSLDFVRDADLVIAYCVKDFRGYEAARTFRKHGINAAIMKPHGMRGWIEEGLPVAGSKGLPEAEALAALRALAETKTAAAR